MFTTMIQNLEPGAVILPPARELSLWMRRRCRERLLPPSALWLTITEIREGHPDKRGRWLVVKCDETPEWRGGWTSAGFTFKARPTTPWQVVSLGVGK